MTTHSTSDLLNETFSVLDEEPAEKRKTKDFTADEHLKFQKKLDQENNPLITQLQKEARERTFLGSDTGTPLPKKRGRPPKAPTTPPTTPNRSKTPPPGPQPEAPKPDQLRIRRMKQIYAYFKLYPHLVSIIGATNLAPFDLATLDEILGICKSEAASGNEGSLEYAAISKILYGALYYFEPICAYLEKNFVSGVATGLLSVLANNPPGSFAQYIQLCNEAGSGVEMELREIAIDFIDFFPTNVYSRLVMKIAYKVYDFHLYKANDYLAKMQQQMASAPHNPEIQKRISALKKK